MSTPRPRVIDRSFVRLIMIKRFSTAALSYAAAIGLSIAVAVHGSAPPLQFALALVIFAGGGTWALRDALRMRRELKGAASTAAVTSSSEGAS